MTNEPPQMTNSVDEVIGLDEVETTSGASDLELQGVRVAIVGRLAGMNRREAGNLLRSHGAIVTDADATILDWLVIGAEEPPLAEAELIEQSLRGRTDPGLIQIVRETELWQRLGLIEEASPAGRLYTPAMLAHLLGVSVRVIRRWHRRGLIRPVRTLHRLPYFDFQEVATARRLAAWVASGASPQAIERRLMELIDIVPNLRRPLDQLSILIEGKHVLLRQGEGLVEPGGQLRFDFDLGSEPDVVPILRFQAPIETTRRRSIDAFPPDDLDEEQDDLLMSAYVAEDEGDLAVAVDCYHAILSRDGSRADIHFQIAELLYRMGETIAARERYYAALEVDPEFVEARSSLAGILAETGQIDLAIAAYRGSLTLHDGYSDVHYNLAKLLDENHRPVEAEHHWRRFLELSPMSPWADEAMARLEEEST